MYIDSNVGQQMTKCHGYITLTNHVYIDPQDTAYSQR
jgi:hypothetical protein